MDVCHGLKRRSVIEQISRELWHQLTNDNKDRQEMIDRVILDKWDDMKKGPTKKGQRDGKSIGL